MGIDGLVRETPVRRRRISYFLIVALAASIGLLAGTKLPRHGPCRPIDTIKEHDEAIWALTSGCTTPERARIILDYYDVGYDAEAFRLRKLCAVMSNGLERLPAALRALDSETRWRLVGVLSWRAREPEIADLLFDFVPGGNAPNLEGAARYNIARGNLQRARIQLTTLITERDRIAALNRSTRYHYPDPVDDAYVLSKLMLAGLDAQAQAAGGSNR